MNEAVILANGEFPEHQIPLNILYSSNNLICCDGAVNKLDEMGVMPTLILGDLDSIKAELKQKYNSKIIQIERQSDTDLEKALKYCVNANIKEVIILGFNGLRDDHYLSNIFLGWKYSKEIEIKLFEYF